MGDPRQSGKKAHTASSLRAAVQAAAEINALFAAQGKFDTPSPPIVQPELKTVKRQGPNKKEFFTAEVEINDLPARVRNLLTKGYIQEQIQWKSKAALCTKGRFFRHNEKPQHAEDRPLYICVQSVNPSATKDAVTQIQQFIESHTSGGKPNAKSPTQSPEANPVLPLIQDRVYINLDHAPLAFGLWDRVLGEGGANVAYIQNETGVSLSLRGQPYIATDTEPLHFLLEHHNPDVVQSARSLALSLVGTLQQDFVQWQKQQQSFYLSCPATVLPNRSNLQSTASQYVYAGTSHRDVRPPRVSRFDVTSSSGTDRGHVEDGEPYAKRQRFGSFVPNGYS